MNIMGICLQYTSTEPIAPAKTEAIIADLNAAVRDARQPWLWCEPPCLAASFDGKIQGWSKLNPIPCPDERADADRYHPDAENDLTFLLGQLCRLSREHGVAWELGLDLMEETLGRIVDGACDPSLEEMINILLPFAEEVGDLGPDELELDDLI
jgi:hypothetical protein